MGRRRHSREIALQILYFIDVTEIPPDEAFRLYYQIFDDELFAEDHFRAPQKARSFAEELVRGVYGNRPEIDQLIVSASKHWRLERMSIVDRNTLRIALYEMLYCVDIPAKVSLNEAIDLGKIYGSEDSSAFINGILDHLLPTLPRSRDPMQEEASSPVAD